MTTIKSCTTEPKPRIYPLLDPALASHDGARKEKEIRELTKLYFK